MSNGLTFDFRQLLKHYNLKVIKNICYIHNLSQKCDTIHLLISRALEELFVMVYASGKMRRGALEGLHSGREVFI